MKGDFSRIRFDPTKQFSAVLKQQGRVDLDADDNEQSAIASYMREATTVDAIGRSGGPVADAGFAISVTDSQILIGAGRYYVDGVLVENRAQVSYDQQPFLIDPRFSTRALLDAVAHGGKQFTAQLQLEVWQRLVTRLDDACLQEPALGQADTTVRLQTIWRVVASLQDATSAPTDANGRPLSGCQAIASSRLFRTGALSAATGQAGNECGCGPVSSGGYQGLENQLYRVEIHHAGPLETATFKWSRENGSIVSQVTDISGAVITTSSLGPDANLGFQAGQWVELTDDTNLFGEPGNEPGSLYQILSTNQATLQITLTTPVTGIDRNRNARIRRWDQGGVSATAQGVPLSILPMLLENGIEVTFRKGQYQAGDYWTFPARTASAQIEWPPCGSDGNLFQPAQFTRVHAAPLACIQLRFEGSFAVGTQLQAFQSNRFTVQDCRLLFPPLTAITPNTPPPAMHVTATSWVNDEIITVDTLLQTGLSVTFDQPPACPWGGGNFQVFLEPPFSADAFTTQIPVTVPTPGSSFFGLDVFLRTSFALDPPTGITVAGSQVSWILPKDAGGPPGFGEFVIYAELNALLRSPAPAGFARVLVKLTGGGVYANGPGGNVYLDGASFGQTGLRSGDQSPCVHLALPTGNASKASNFESWFYLAPSLVIASATIMLLNGTTQVGTNIVSVQMSLSTGKIAHLFAPGAAGNISIVTAVQAVIKLTYPVIAPTTITLTLTGTGVGTVVTIQPSVTVPAGQFVAIVPINILTTPGLNVQGAPNTDTVTLGMQITNTLLSLPSFQGTAPTLQLTDGGKVL